MNDLISRQAAIEAIEHRLAEPAYQHEGEDWYTGMNCAESELYDLPPAQPDNQTNLCDSCGYSYPECPSKNDDVIFGNGIGNDNICACNKYKPSAQPQTSMLTVECKLDDEELAKAIEEVKKANLELIAAEPHWIPCSEQLPPEENKTYWVCTDNGHQHECRWTNANPIWTHLTTDWHWNIFDIPQYTKVVAWMELPKPYDGGEQDE